MIGPMMKLVVVLTVSVATAPGAVLATESPAPTGSLTAVCVDCHGKDGASTYPDVPIIGGLSAFALEENLYAFRARERPCRTTYYRAGEPDRPATDMCQIAGDLSDDDIVQIAAFFASKPFVPANQQPDPEMAARGAEIHDRACHHCHGEGGSDPADHASILAGQWMTYLRLAFVSLRAGERWMPRNMDTRLAKLTDQDIEALVHYYASGANLHDSNEPNDSN